ncbi:MAG: cellobiose phosphorylase [Bacillota bacterium]|nr:MAG: cellobiose phosphorylase [Bacillota bacterium]
MKDYRYENNQFIIKNYDQKKPFASFLPGVAGLYGIPMWVYYVNRGQLIAGFGIENKDHAILDFSPANLAYRRTEIDGFRTFIKIDGQTYEAFQVHKNPTNRYLKIESNAVSIEEEIHGVLVTVKYFNVSKQNYPGLVRKVTIKNLDQQPKTIELIDGLATMWPYGTNAFMVKNMSNLAVAWFDVFNQENNMPYMKNRSTTEDTAEVGNVDQGHFYVSVNQDSKKLSVIYDPTLIFGYETSLKNPVQFEDRPLIDLLKSKQASVNQLLSGFSADAFELENTYTFYTLFGQMNSLDELNEKGKLFTFEYFETLERYAAELEKEVLNPLQVKTSYPLFDAYLKQSFLDNFLRGGYPLVFKGKNNQPIVYHVYSRIHGDMEREYNNFFVEPAYFSHGNGSYRDVNQNRRNDIYFVPEAGLFNIRQFIELIQLDGHNPLTIQGSRLVVDASDIPHILKDVITHQEDVKKVLSKPFTPGKLMTTIDHINIELACEKEAFLNHVMHYATQDIESVYGTGYWSDHWVYNMDLLDQYLNIYPDKLEELLFQGSYRFYQSHISVYPRSIKYVLNHENQVRQLEPLYHDQEKIDKAHIKVNQTNFHKTKDHSVFKTSLFAKYVHLALIKFASLDPEMMGVMMDSEKPGWNDAMNGLPAIFGSGVSETIALKRLLVFLKDTVKSLNKDSYQLPQVFIDLFSDVLKAIPNGFDAIQDTRENFDEKNRIFIDPSVSHISAKDLLYGLDVMIDKVNEGLEKARNIGEGILPTYFTFEAKEFDVTDRKHPITKTSCVSVHSWTYRMLPHYLEAPANDLKITEDKAVAKTIYDRIKKTELFDKEQKLYLTSRPLDEETLTIGRARAFTKGWLEREACFMHMSYKYLIGLMKSGLYDEYYQDIKTSMPPFMNPEVYGRSLLENVSFIATSNNPNMHNHGRGFVARLTGTTSEAMTLMFLMMLGKHPFTYEQHELHFHVEPKLEASFFDENNQVSLRLFDYIDLTIVNPLKKHTYQGLNPVSYELYEKGKLTTVKASKVSGELAIKIRDRHFEKIVVTLG